MRCMSEVSRLNTEPPGWLGFDCVMMKHEQKKTERDAIISRMVGKNKRGA